MDVASFIGALLVFIFAGLFLVGIGVILGVILGERRLVRNKVKYNTLRAEWTKKECIKLREKAKMNQSKADSLDAKSDILNSKAASYDAENSDSNED